MTEATDERQVDILIVGAGLVGSLAAVFLARRGFAVDVYERRPDMRKVGISAGRSINLNISCRGLEALRRIGLVDDVLPEVVPMMGRMMHSRDGALTYQAYGKDDTEYGNSVSRGGLNKLLMDKAEATGQVRFHFNMKAQDSDFDRNSITFLDENNKTVIVRAAVIFGTDGAASAVREQMMKLDDFESSVEQLDYGYKELYIAPAEDGGFKLDKGALHIWPRGTYMLIALPNFDGSFTVTLFLPYKGDISFEKLTTEQSVRDFFTEHFADAAELMPDYVQAFMNNPTGHMETVKCHPWNVGGQCLLMGDAAHGIVPFFGQGMNCGFEDLSIFDECVEDHISQGGTIFVERRSHHREDERRNFGKLLHDGEANWLRVFTDFYERRKDNCDAIADMAVENFIEMRDKVGDPKFLLAKGVEKILEKKFPGKYISRYSLVTFSNVPYRLAQQAGTICDGILAELVAGIEKPDQVDLALAERLVDERLAPMLVDRPELKTKLTAK
ncbi:MAG: NAD(P)/FAD-dependent oxidoreductase [Candidatus Melainabacteria bacterium]|nr:NAD(P)/FAD-dependent oxidoreductase [Candidatus Melainabacteria bacterium]